MLTDPQGLGAIATMTGYVIGSFKLRYPHVHNMADAGEIIAGPIGREVLGTTQVLFSIFLCGSHVLTGTIAFNTSTCLELNISLLRNVTDFAFSYRWSLLLRTLGRGYGHYLSSPDSAAHHERCRFAEYCCFHIYFGFVSFFSP